MSLLRRSAFALFFAVCTPAAGFAAADPAGCVPPTIHTDTVKIVEACDAALAAPDLAPDRRAAFMLSRGRGYKADGKLVEAIADFEAGIALAPGNLQLRVFRGWAAYDQRDFKTMDRIAEDLLVRYPEEADVHDLIGVAATARNDLAGGRRSYDQALALNPDHVSALEHRSHLFWRVRAYEPALKDFALLADSKSPDADLQFVDFYGRRISYRTHARLSSVQILENMGHTERAEKGFEEFARVEPGPISYGWWGLFHHRRSQYEQAQEELEKALSYAPDFWFLHNLIGANLFSMKQYERALQSVDRALALNPKSGASYWQRAKTLRELDRMDEAIEGAIMAVEVDPPFFRRLVPKLMKLGYLQAGPNEASLTPMVRDAVRACMLDEGC